MYWLGGISLTLEQLNQYLSLKKEEKMWTQELEELRRQSTIPVKDTVCGSCNEFPYTEHTITVSGIEQKQREKQEKLEARLLQRRERTSRERETIETFIDGLQDSQLRQIVYYRYIKGYGWTKIARLMHNKESALQMKLKRYF